MLSAACARLANTATYRDSPVSTLHFIVEVPGHWTSTSISGVIWVIEIRTQVLTFLWQTLYPLSLIPSLHLVMLFITSCGNSILFPIMATPIYISNDNVES